MRLMVLLTGLFCLRQIDFGAAGWWASTAFPVLGFLFVIYLIMDMLFFVFLLQHGDSLKIRNYSEDDLWPKIYAGVAPVIDPKYRFELGNL